MTTISSNQPETNENEDLILQSSCRGATIVVRRSNAPSAVTCSLTVYEFESSGESGHRGHAAFNAIQGPLAIFVVVHVYG